MSSIPRWLQEPDVADCPVDGLARFDAHRAVLRRKRMIRGVFDEFHNIFIALDSQYFKCDGLVIELGAGVYPVKETSSKVLATDIVAAPHLDRVLDAGAMDLADESVHAFYLQNVFHHFPEPHRFFRELERTLQHGGGAIMIEPACGPFATWLYPRLFATEDYDKDAESWNTPVGGPMSGANQALSYLVFDRDLPRFEADHSGLEIVHTDVLQSWPRYLMSGGLNFRPLLPSFMINPLRLAETILRPLRSQLGLHRIIVLRKRMQAD